MPPKARGRKPAAVAGAETVPSSRTERKEKHVKSAAPTEAASASKGSKTIQKTTGSRGRPPKKRGRKPKSVTEVSGKRLRSAATAEVAPQEPPAKAVRKEKTTLASVKAVDDRRGSADRKTKKDVADTLEPAHESNDVASSSPTAASQSERFSLLRRYLPPLEAASAATDKAWNTSDALVYTAYLAQVQCSFVRACCQLLAKLTTSTSPAFLHAAALGEAALGSGFSSRPAQGDGVVLRSHTQLLSDVDPLVDRQEEAYRILRATIAASCTLGHRSCQVLWGPRGCGKHRMLRLLAQEVRRTPNTFVMELHGRLLRDDEAALGVLAQQLFAFLQSPQSQQLRDRHYLLRSGTFGFGQLFHFERRMQEAAAAAGADGAAAEVDAAAHEFGRKNTHTVHHDDPAILRSRKPPLPRGRRAATAAAHSSESSDSADDSSEDDDDMGEDGQDGTALMVTSTTTYLTGGAASALPHLQRALLLLKSLGCSLVVCIRDIDVFGIRCDQLLYVLSGLMHDSDGGGSGGGGNNRGGGVGGVEGDGGGSGGGGGLSLVLASAAPDIRQLEKRLSSRLTCETRYVPLLPWTLTGLLAATLHISAQDASFQLQVRETSRERIELLTRLRDGATRLRRLRENLPTGRGTSKKRKADEAEMRDVQDQMAALEARLHAAEATLRELRAQRRHFLGFLDTEGITGGTAGAPSAAATSTTASGGLTAVLPPGSMSGWRPTNFPPRHLPANAPDNNNNKTAAAAGGASSGAGASSPSAPSPLSTSSGSVIAPRSWTVARLHAQPGLTLEVQCVLCEELLRQLRLAAATATTASTSTAVLECRTQVGEGAARASAASPAAALVQRVTALSTALELESGTAATVLTALASLLCKTASGAVDLMGASGRRVVLRWLRARLQHEVIPLVRDEATPVGEDPAACPPGLPVKLLTCWREAAQALVLAAAPSSTSPDTATIKHTNTNASLHAAPTASLNLPKLKETESMYYRGSSGTSISLPPLSLLPPHLFDLFADGQLVGMGYGSREMLLVLFYMHLHHTRGVLQRTVADLLEDVSSSLGTRAAAALDREAFRYAIRLLCRWRLLSVADRHAQSVQLCGSHARLREFLTTVLSKQPAWCEAELGLDARDILRFRNMV